MVIAYGDLNPNPALQCRYAHFRSHFGSSCGEVLYKTMGSSEYDSDGGLVALLASLHRKALLKLALAGGMHFEGLQQASRKHAFGSRMRRRLRGIETCLVFARRHTRYKVESFLRELDDELALHYGEGSLAPAGADNEMKLVLGYSDVSSGAEVDAASTWSTDIQVSENDTSHSAGGCCETCFIGDFCKDIETQTGVSVPPSDYVLAVAVDLGEALDLGIAGLACEQLRMHMACQGMGGQDSSWGFQKS